MNLIFDGNYLFYKTLFIFGGYSGGKRLLDDKKDQDMFMRKIATDMSHAIRNFGSPDKLIFTIDARSWRKDVLIEDGAYKGTRTKDESKINWDQFYKMMNEFGEILTKKGFIVSREDRAEGDDLMHLWADHLFQQGEDSVIITGDGDLTQCVRMNEKNFVVCFNPNSKNRKIVAPIGFKEWLKTESYDLFDASTYMGSNKDLIAEAMHAIPVEEIDPAFMIFCKVITGDAGDAVPPVWTWEAKGKTYRVTPAKAERIYEILNHTKFIDDIYNLPERAMEVANGIAATCKQTVAADIIKSRLTRNITLVYLDERVIPQDIQDNFKISFEKHKNDSLPAANYDMTHLLSGTNYMNGPKIVVEADIFKDFGM